MINHIYRLIGERRIEMQLTDEMIGDKVVVRPLYLSICAADQRYFQALRKTEILEQKLPMALIHEAVGEVVYGNDEFEVGDKVVMIPNSIDDSNTTIKENYVANIKFQSSNCDGYMQEVVFMDSDRLLNVADQDLVIATLLEPLSVAVNAIREFARCNVSIDSNAVFAVWGDGSIGYMMGLVIKHYYPNAKLIICGKNREKLTYFSFADETYLINRLPKNFKVDHAFECVGGKASSIAINQIIGLITPQGCISLLGVSEDPILIDTRMVLEKGLLLLGHSRSSKADFAKAISIMNNDYIKDYLTKIISEVLTINDIDDIYDAFEADMNNPFKTILRWDI